MKLAAVGPLIARYSLALALGASSLFAIFISGCATEDERMTLTLEERLQASLPEPPPVLSSQVLMLFTNQPGFGAQCRIERGAAAKTSKPLEGQLLHRGDQFLFAAEAQEKNARGREMTFVWNAGKDAGYALNDALPGYAPLVARAQLKNVSSTGRAPSEEKVNGHLCTREQLTVSLTDGTESQITVWRAEDLRGLPVRIRADSGTRFLVDLLDVRFQEPSAALFEIPRDFTKYENPKAMFDELFRRESLTRRTTKEKPSFDEDAFQKSGAGTTR